MRRLTLIVNKQTGYVDMKWWTAGDLGRFLNAFDPITSSLNIYIHVSKTQYLED